MSGYGLGLYGSGIYGGDADPFISGTYISAISKFTTSPIILVEVHLPETTLYYSKSTARFSDTQYDGIVVSVGQLRRSIQNALGLFEVASIEVVFSDILTDSQNYLLGSSETYIYKGATVILKVGEKSLALTDYITFFQGKIDDFGGEAGGFRINLKDNFWTIPASPGIGYVTETNFPNALPAIIGKPLPFCYGIHSATDDTTASLDADARNRGAWPTMFIDRRNTSRYFLIAYHSVLSIDNVYAYTPGRGSLELTLGTDYLAWPAGFIEGQRCAFIEITSTGWTDKVTDTSGNLGEITVNVKGKTDAEDGSGSLLLNPVLILKDIFKYYLGDPSINSTKFDQAASVSDSRAYQAAGGYINQLTSQQFLKEISDSFSIRLYPDIYGRVSVDIFEPAGPADVITSILEQSDILQGSYSVDFQANVQGSEDAQIINKVDYQHRFHWAKQTFLGNNKIEDATSISSYGEKGLSIPMKWNATQGGAKDIASRYVFLYRNPVAHVNFKTTMKGTYIDLSDQINVSHWQGSKAGGFVAERFEVIDHQFNPEDYTTTLRAIDVESITQRAYFLGDEDSYARATAGTMGVVNGSGVVTRTGGSTFVGVVSIGDILRLKTVTNEGNRKNLKVTAVAATTLTVSNTVWTNESSIAYDVIPSWLTASADQLLHGHLCDESTGQFSDASEGFLLL